MPCVGFESQGIKVDNIDPDPDPPALPPPYNPPSPSPGEPLPAYQEIGSLQVAKYDQGRDTVPLQSSLGGIQLISETLITLIHKS